MRGVALNSSPTLGAPGFWLACHTCHRAISAPRRFDIHATDRTVPCALPIIHLDQPFVRCPAESVNAIASGTTPDPAATRTQQGGGRAADTCVQLSARSISLAGL